jgi:hypothetical protein
MRRIKMHGTPTAAAKTIRVRTTTKLVPRPTFAPVWAFILFQKLTSKSFTCIWSSKKREDRIVFHGKSYSDQFRPKLLNSKQSLHLFNPKSEVRENLSPQGYFIAHRVPPHFPLTSPSPHHSSPSLHYSSPSHHHSSPSHHHSSPHFHLLPPHFVIVPPSYQNETQHNDL